MPGPPHPSPPAHAPGIGWWTAAASVVFVALTMTDLALAEETAGALAYLGAIGPAAAIGCIHGLAWGLAFALLRRVPARVAATCWILAGLAGATWLIASLGAIDRLGGPHALLALIALGASTAGGVAFGLGAMAFQPTRARPIGLVPSLPVRARVALVVALAPLIAGATWADRSVMLGQHEAAHLALRLAAGWALVFALTTLAPPVAGRELRRGLAAATAAVLLAGISIATLGPAREVELQTILSRPFSALALESARSLADVDRDGYAAILGGADCDEGNAAISPGTTEIPGNGIDENCRLGDASADAFSLDEVAWPATPPARSIVLITVDTVAESHTSLRGRHRRDTTPQLRAWSRDAAVFDRAFTSGGWTSLAISSLMRGVYPRRLHWTLLYETSHLRLLRAADKAALDEDETLEKAFGLPLDDPRPALPAWLTRRGLYTAAVVYDGLAEFLDPEFMSLGFDRYVDLDTSRGVGKRAVDDADVTDAAIAELAAMPADRPFFLWVHYFGPHSPNTHHPKVESFGRSQADLYDHEILHLDGELARLLAHVDDLAAKREVMTIVTSDHGELMRKTERDHGLFLWDDAIHVPLVIKGGGVAAGHHDFIVSLVDLFPTVAAATGSPIPPLLDGIDLVPLTQGEPDDLDRVLIAETWTINSSGELVYNKIAGFDDDLKLIWNVRDDAKMLQPNDDTHRNSVNLLDDPAYDASRLRDHLAAYLEANGTPDLRD